VLQLALIWRYLRSPMKYARPPLGPLDLHRADALLTTMDVARLLRVHPKHVYRLLRRGLPGHRVGGEWRFLAAEVVGWCGAVPSAPEQTARGAAPAETPATPSSAAALVATNGDLAVEYLLARLTSGRPLFGHVQADRGQGLELLKRGDVLATGCHGGEIPTTLAQERLAFIHLVDREVGLALRRGVRMRSLRQIGRWRLASRPQTAGVRVQFDDELRKNGVDPEALHGRAVLLPSHGEVVWAVARGDCDVGLASLAWASRVGLECVPLYRETYGLLVRASSLGDPGLIRLCQLAQSAEFRREVGAVRGYETRQTGTITYEPPKSPARARAARTAQSPKRSPS
jgi:excisionase family DNA binding protein